MEERSLKAMLWNQFPLQTHDKVRYADTDRQGHVNNAVFSQFFETGRVEMLLHPSRALTASDASFVIASSKIDYLSEIIWPGTVEIGTFVRRVGTSSVHLAQALYQFGEIVALSETVIVQVNNATSRSMPLTEATKALLLQYFIE